MTVTNFEAALYSPRDDSIVVERALALAEQSGDGGGGGGGGGAIFLGLVVGAGAYAWGGGDAQQPGEALGAAAFSASLMRDEVAWRERVASGSPL